jgi:hypothetical protein
MKTLSLSNVLKAIKFTVTRDGRMAAGKFNYYEDATMDAVLSNPTSHFMLNGSLSLPSIAYSGSEKSGALELNNGHYAVFVNDGSQVTSVVLPTPSAEVLHRTYVIVNQKAAGSGTTIPVKYFVGQTETPIFTLAAVNGTNTVQNSITVQCQRTSRGYSSSQTYTWRIVSVGYAPLTGTSVTTTTYYGGIFKINLLRTTGASISASTLSSYITVTQNGACGIPQTGNSNQIIRQFTSGQTVSVAVSSSLPSGYTFSYWQLKSPSIGSVSASQPFTQALDTSGTSASTNITEIDLVFSYSAPITSSTYSYGSSSSGYSSMSSCPTPSMLIMINEHTWVKAGSRKVGDYVYTKHENTGEWGNYKVIQADRVLQPVLSVNVGGKLVEVSESHKFLLSTGEYVKISDIKEGTLIQTLDGDLPLISKESIGKHEVVKLEIDQAHTYVVEGIHSHNKISSSFGIA